MITIRKNSKTRIFSLIEEAKLTFLFKHTQNGAEETLISEEEAKNLFIENYSNVKVQASVVTNNSVSYLKISFSGFTMLSFMTLPVAKSMLSEEIQIKYHLINGTPEDIKPTPVSSDKTPPIPSNVVHGNFRPKRIGVKNIIVTECSSSAFRENQVLELVDFEKKCTEEAIANGKVVTDVSGFILFSNGQRFFFDIELSSMAIDCHLNLSHAFDDYIKSIQNDSLETFVMCVDKSVPDYESHVKEMTGWYNFIKNFNSKYQLKQAQK